MTNSNFHLNLKDKNIFNP